jgi:N-glycosylase/DNA lyase
MCSILTNVGGNMTEISENTGLFLCPARELDIEKTFECGQCFRWNADGAGGYTGVASGRAATLRREGDGVYIDAPEGELPFWRYYFDLDEDYEAATRSVSVCEYLRECADYGAGIRILRQDKWEALCSFLISQCNNIPRIKAIVEALCALAGDEIRYRGETRYAFPTAEQVAALSPEALAPLRCGYRAPYLLSAARAVTAGEPDLEALAELPGPEARMELLRLRGVGGKVADCAVLFGLHRMDAFPVDTWMKKALKAHFPPDFDPASLGEYAGLAQQYIFYRARDEGRRRQ